MLILSIASVLDLAGTFVFALSGGMLAVRSRLDIVGVLVLAVAAGLAGGIVRDVVIGAEPPAAFADSKLMLAALSAGFVTFFCHRLIERLSKPVMLLDALGLGLFAVSGCSKALLFGLGWFPAVLLGVVTAVGGGVLRDLLVAQRPRVLSEEIYAVAALVGATMVVAGAALRFPEFGVTSAAIAVTFVIRVLSVRRGWRAPRSPFK